MREVEGKNKGVKRAATDEAEKDPEPKKDLFEPPIKRSNKEMRFQSKSQEDRIFFNRLRNDGPGEGSRPLPESDTDSDDNGATLRNPKDDEDFS